MSIKTTVAVALSMLMFPVLTLADTYKIDESHSDVTFTVRHLGVSKTRGQFGDVSGKIKWDPKDFSKTSFEGKIKVKSIDTQNKKRDKHLLSSDFFDEEQFPEITFESTKITNSDDGIVVEGNLTLHGVTKKVVIPMEVLGPVKGPYGSQRIGFEGDLKIDRRDYGLNWSKSVQNGSLVVGNDVSISLSVQGKR